MKKVALFDFDGTITNKDTIIFLVFELLKLKPLRLFLITKTLFKILFLNKNDSIQDHKNEILFILLKNLSNEQIEKALKKYTQKIKKLHRPLILDAFKRLKNEDVIILVVTASPDFAVKKALEQFNVEVIGTKFEVTDNKFTGKLNSLNCYDNEKINRIKLWKDSKKTDINLSIK